MPEILPLSAAPHANHQLFSDHYLNRTLPQRQDWAELLAAAAPVREKIAALFAGFAPSKKEAHTERTSAIVAQETDLNARVYALFGLAEAEIALIEAATKYRYGEV